MATSTNTAVSASRASASQAIKDAFNLVFDIIPESKLALISAVEIDPTTDCVSVTLNNDRVRCPTCRVWFANEKDAGFHQRGKLFTCGGHGLCMNRDEAVDHVSTESHSRCFLKGCVFGGGGRGATTTVREHMRTSHGL